MDFTDNGSKQILSWFCCNCGTKVSAIKTVDGFYKAKCSRCGSCSVRKVMGRRHDTIEVYAPKGCVNIHMGR